MIATRGLGRGAQGYMAVSGFGRGSFTQTVIAAVSGGGAFLRSMKDRVKPPEDKAPDVQKRHREELELLTILLSWIETDEKP